jgi:conjugative relaxase-like TrwC/TraI family protein
MLTSKPQYSLGNAKKYFREHLCAGDYYAEGQHVSGEWFGKGAAELGLSGVIHSEEFLRLCENLHPQTGQRLTLRQKTTRTQTGNDGQEQTSANRRIFYDFTISPPKSVSIAALVGNDHCVVEAHERAVNAALGQLELFASTRVRRNRQCADRTTGNIVAAVFRHETSRSLDPHLHSHCIVFNATHDLVEGRCKALQNHDMLKASKFIENVYYHQLVRSLRQMGYEIESKPRGDFEIKGVSSELIDKFSKRHHQIDEMTNELLTREPEKANGNIATIREIIAHKERPQKVRDLGLPKLQEMWNAELTPSESVSLRNLNSAPTRISAPAGEVAKQAVDWAEEHLFDRHSVVNLHEIWRHALEHARGQDISFEDIKVETERRDYLPDKSHSGKVTTREALQREWEIVSFAREGIEKHQAFNPDYRASNLQLDSEQAHAVESILASGNFVTLFRGGAGTGKSYTLKEVQCGLQLAGHVVQVIAPQRQQVCALENDGFRDAQTVSAFLTRQAMAQGSVVILDEAGQVGGKQMHALLRFVKAHNGRVILSGDTRQHGAVEATDALRAIEKYSGIRPIELLSVRRQNPGLAKSTEDRQRIEDYKQAVIEASNGKLVQSFDRLDKQGAIEECTLTDQHEKLARRYLDVIKAQHSAVVVSQSWNEIHKVNEQIRSALKGERRLGETETCVTAFQPVNLTDAQKRDMRFYDQNAVLVFNRHLKNFRRGDAAQFVAVADSHLVVECDGREYQIPFENLDKITVCQCKELALSPGDRLQLKANGKSADGRRLCNGELVTVKSVLSGGRIELAGGRILGKDFRQFVLGYAVTSYASQGKTVGYVLFSDSNMRAATNDQQWYVTISRGRKGIHIFTTDKQQLRENIARSGHRPLAMEMVSPEKEPSSQGTGPCGIKKKSEDPRKCQKRIPTIQSRRTRRRQYQRYVELLKRSRGVRM